MKRREFISSVALSSLAAVGTVQAGEPESGAGAPSASAPPVGEGGERAQVKRYRPLGKTGMKVSDISFGGGQLPAGSLVLRAIERGVNYFDTAPDYGRSEEFIGEAMKKFKEREKIYLASKFCDAGAYISGKSHLPQGTTKAQYKAAVEGSLQRMHTEYLDVVFVHAMGERNDTAAERSRLLDDTMLTAFDELKKEGKARFLAVSSHGPNGMEDLMMTAVKSGHYDLIMPAFNFMKFPKVPEVIKEAGVRGVGVIAMKTLAGAKDMAMDPKGIPFEHAAFRWVLQHPEVAGLVVTMKSIKDLENYLQASGGEFTAADQRSLDRYAALYGSEYCRTGCGDCHPGCPHGVEIGTILRYQMYFEDYADQKRAMQSYAGLERSAAICLACGEGSCTAACPHGLPVDAKMRAAHQTLSFQVG